jgi:prepilin-type N-terminal cleavage/methylation domain-containing protein
MELRVRYSPALMPAGRRQRHRHRGQLGLTLTELLVAIAILAIIGGSLAGAFGIGLRLLGPTGAQAKLTGNADLLAFEQHIGADVARADCLAAPGMQSIPTGGCQRSVPSTCAPSQYSLCLAWYVPGSACHIVAYWQQSDGTLVRSDLTTNTNTNTTTRIATGGLKIAASWTPEVTSNGGYKWTKQVTIAVTQQGISGAPAATQPVKTTFQLVPLAADPLSAALPGGVSSC